MQHDNKLRSNDNNSRNGLLCHNASSNRQVHSIIPSSLWVHSSMNHIVSSEKKPNCNTDINSAISAFSCSRYFIDSPYLGSTLLQLPTKLYTFFDSLPSHRLRSRGWCLYHLVNTCRCIRPLAMTWVEGFTIAGLHSYATRSKLSLRLHSINCWFAQLRDSEQTLAQATLDQLWSFFFMRSDYYPCTTSLKLVHLLQLYVVASTKIKENACIISLDTCRRIRPLVMTMGRRNLLLLFCTAARLWSKTVAQATLDQLNDRSSSCPLKDR